MTKLKRFLERVSPANKIRVALNILGKFVVLTWGRVSRKQKSRSSTSPRANPSASNEGRTNQAPPLAVLFENMANMAPIMGPTMKPNEKATPTSAMPRPRVRTLDTSVITLMQSDMLPLLMPPTIRASTNSAKLLEQAQIK